MMRAAGAPNQAYDCYTDQMTTRMSATEAKAKILSLLHDVEAGDEVEITRHGRTIARLVPASGPHALRGTMSGVAMSTTASEDELFSTDAEWSLE